MKKKIIRFIARINVNIRFYSISREARLSLIEYKMLHVPSYEEIMFNLEFEEIISNL